MFEGIKRVFADFIEAFRREIGDVKIYEPKSDFQVVVNGGGFENIRIGSRDFKIEIGIREETAKSDSVSFFVVDVRPDDLELEIKGIDGDEEIRVFDLTENSPLPNPEIITSGFGAICSGIELQSLEFEKIDCTPKELFLSDLFAKSIMVMDFYGELFWDVRVAGNSITGGEIRIGSHEVAPVFAMNSSDSIWGTIPIRRKMANWDDYTRKNVKDSLEFIVERMEEKSKLKYVGVYRDIPLDRVKRMIFENGMMEFTLRENGRKRGIILDVLVVKDEKAGKYHVGPIVRKY